MKKTIRYVNEGFDFNQAQLSDNDLNILKSVQNLYLDKIEAELKAKNTGRWSIIRDTCNNTIHYLQLPYMYKISYDGKLHIKTESPLLDSLISVIDLIISAVGDKIIKEKTPIVISGMNNEDITVVTSFSQWSDPDIDFENYIPFIEDTTYNYVDFSKCTLYVNQIMVDKLSSVDNEDYVEYVYTEFLNKFKAIELDPEASAAIKIIPYYGNNIFIYKSKCVNEGFDFAQAQLPDNEAVVNPIDLYNYYFGDLTNALIKKYGKDNVFTYKTNYEIQLYYNVMIYHIEFSLSPLAVTIILVDNESFAEFDDILDLCILIKNNTHKDVKIINIHFGVITAGYDNNGVYIPYKKFKELCDITFDIFEIKFEIDAPIWLGQINESKEEIINTLSNVFNKFQNIIWYDNDYICAYNSSNYGEQYYITQNDLKIGINQTVNEGFDFEQAQFTDDEIDIVGGLLNNYITKIKDNVADILASTVAYYYKRNYENPKHYRVRTFNNNVYVCLPSSHGSAFPQQGEENEEEYYKSPSQRIPNPANERKFSWHQSYKYVGMRFEVNLDVIKVHVNHRGYYDCDRNGNISSTILTWVYILIAELKKIITGVKFEIVLGNYGFSTYIFNAIRTESEKAFNIINKETIDEYLNVPIIVEKSGIADNHITLVLKGCEFRDYDAVQYFMVTLFKNLNVKIPNFEIKQEKCTTTEDMYNSMRPYGSVGAGNRKSANIIRKAITQYNKAKEVKESLKIRPIYK